MPSHDEIKKLFFLYNPPTLPAFELLLTKWLGKLEIKKRKIEQQRALQLSWEKVHHEGDLLKANFIRLQKGIKTIAVEDWLQDNTLRTLLLDPLLSPQENIRRKFLSAKKLRKAIPFSQMLIEKYEKEEELINNFLLSPEKEALFSLFSASYSREKKELLPKTKEKKNALPYKEFFSASKSSIWVGKSSKDNDLLTFSFAKGADFWLHIADYPGSHVVIPTEKGAPPDSETIQDALQLALHYSKAKKAGAGEVIVTQRKFVFPAGKKGAVYLSQQRRIYVVADKERLLKVMNDR